MPGEAHGPSSDRTPQITITPLYLLYTACRRHSSGGFQIEARLSGQQVNSMFTGLEEKYPPILTYEQAADLVQVALPTLKGWFSQGRFANCVKRGKPGRIARDLFVQQFLRDEFGFNQ
jgi:hypothetical protein